MAPLVTPRARVIVDNDFSGGPDDLFQTAHHLLSPSVEIRMIIGSHLSAGEPWDPSTTQASNAAGKASGLAVSRCGGRDSCRGCCDRFQLLPTPFLPFMAEVGAFKQTYRSPLSGIMSLAVSGSRWSAFGG
jgi:hypothetical protein